MYYPESFKQLVFNDNNPDFIGWGNPNSKILILGKEPAIDMSTEHGRFQYEIEVAHNKQDWYDNIIHQTDYDDVSTVSLSPRDYGNPLFPYFRQKYKVEKRKCGILPKDGDGTSLTWFKSQKLIYMITGRTLIKNGDLDFHKYCFSTDLSSKAALNNMQTNNKETVESIRERQKNLFISDFFKQFPIVIAAIGTYRNLVDWNDYVSKTFAVDRLQSKTIRGVNFTIHEHHNNVHRLVITCCQFSARISNEYWQAIADTAKQFIGIVSSED